jgi:hypothetical protein
MTLKKKFHDRREGIKSENAFLGQLSNRLCFRSAKEKGILLFKYIGDVFSKYASYKQLFDVSVMRSLDLNVIRLRAGRTAFDLNDHFSQRKAFDRLDE